MASSEGSGIERLRRGIGRIGFVTAFIGLVAGTALYGLEQSELASHLFRAAIGVLLVMPLVNVTAVLADEVVRKDWTFVATAGAVLLLLGYAIVTRL